MDVAAENATDDPKDGRASRKESVTASQIVRIGDWNRASTLVKKWGRPRIAWIVRCVDSGHIVQGRGVRGHVPPSRLKPNIIRELDVTENKPQCQTQIMTRTINKIAPVLPKMSIRIWTTGWPTSLSTVVAKS